MVDIAKTDLPVSSNGLVGLDDRTKCPYIPFPANVSRRLGAGPEAFERKILTNYKDQDELRPLFHKAPTVVGNRRLDKEY